MEDFKTRFQEKENEKAKEINKAIWVHNKLIERHPEIYKAMKEEYKRERERKE